MAGNLWLVKSSIIFCSLWPAQTIIFQSQLEKEQDIHEIDLEKGPLYIYVAGLSAKVEVSLM